MGHVAHVGGKEMYTSVLVGKPEGNKQWEDLSTDGSILKYFK
jgi:hypothetical protein